VQAFSACAQLLQSAADQVPKMWKLRESCDLEDAQLREQLAVLIRQAAKYEEEACVVLQDIVSKM